MKIILISIIFFTTLFSDSLVYVKNGISNKIYCVSDKYTEFNESYLFSLLPSNNEFSINKNRIIEIKTNYKYSLSTSKCEPIKNPFEPDENGLVMGMQKTDFNLAMALWGICLSFLMSIGLIISF